MSDTTHVKVSPELAAAIDDAAGLKAISLRMGKPLLERLKLIAEVRGAIEGPSAAGSSPRFTEEEREALKKGAAALTHEAQTTRNMCVMADLGGNYDLEMEEIARYCDHNAATLKRLAEEAMSAQKGEQK